MIYAGVHVTPINEYLRNLWGVGVVLDVLSNQGKSHKETWAHVVFEDETLTYDVNDLEVVTL